jgi:translation initiation factor IF-1
MIALDARVVSVVAKTAFRAELVNGHRFLAFVAREDRDRVGETAPGTVVRVRMSPYDMSRGRIVVAAVGEQG